MPYPSITIGTEQEVRKVYLYIRNDDGSEVVLDQESKILATINLSDEPLVHITGDSYVGTAGDYEAFQLELSTLPAGAADHQGWEKRKEAIRLFMDHYINQETGCKDNEVFSTRDLPGDLPGVHGVYKFKSKAGPLRHFAFYRSEPLKGQENRFGNQITVGISIHDAVQDFEAKGGGGDFWIPWFKDHGHQLNHLQGVTPEQKYLYSYAASLIDMSSRIYVLLNPGTADFGSINFLDEDRNHTGEKNKWKVIPRTAIHDAACYLEQSPQIFTALRNRTYKNGNFREDVVGEKADIVYRVMAGQYWEVRQQGIEHQSLEQLQQAESIFRSGYIFNGNPEESGQKQMLFELREVRPQMTDLYDNSLEYLCI